MMRRVTLALCLLVLATAAGIAGLGASSSQASAPLGSA